MEQRNITDLPFEVLDLIFESCQYLRYKVDLAQVNEKMGEAFAYHCRNEFRRLSPNQRLTTELWVFLIRKCGHSVEELIFDGRGNYWNDLIAQAVANHCPNLKSVCTCFYRSHQGDVHAFLEKMREVLISVELDQREHSPTTIFNAVGQITHLKNFSFKGYVDENVFQIQNLVNLEKLKIEQLYYTSKPSLNILSLFTSLSNLRVLSVSNIQILPFDGPYYSMWAGLESLSLRQCTFSIELPDCPKIKDLDIMYTRCQIEGYLLRFILKNGKNIITLNERCDPPFNADGFLQLLRGCPKLRLFYTPMEYIKLYLGYVSTIVEILKENGVTPEDPFELIIARRIKWKWFRRLLRRVPDANLIDLIEDSE